jgi:hypothetical protein
MPKRNTPSDFKSFDDLNQIDKIVVDKRNAKRADAKKNRRDRHYTKMFIKLAVKDHLKNNNDETN